MIISVHQALFGEYNRGHGLLTSSLPDSALRSTVPLVTDLPGSAIPPNLQWEPYLRGYVAGRYYVFSKTFPDPSASRPGMVFTHVLLVDRTEIFQINRLDEILPLLTEKIDKSSSVHSLQISITETAPPKIVPPGYGKVVNTLLTNPQRTVIWVGDKGFTQIIEALWTNLWPDAREKFSFRISFAPQDLQDNPPTIVCVPEALASRWSHEPVVRITDEYTPNPSNEMYLAEAFLMGLTEAEPLREFQRKLNAFLPELTTLRMLARSLSHGQEIENGTDSVDHVRDLVRSLAKLAPSSSDGMTIKQKAITRLQALTSQGTASDIRAFRNITLTQYPNASTFFSETISAWMHHRLIVESDREPKAVAELMALALSDSSDDWTKTIKSNLDIKFGHWNEQTARMVWQWWGQRPSLVQQLEEYMPERAGIEQSLINQCPRELPAQLGEALLALSQNRKWFSLHGVICLGLYPPLVAIKQHLEFDRSPSFEDALRQLVKRLDTKTVLDTALNIGENRLLRLAGEMCAKEPSFLAELNLNSREWRIIWYESILMSKNPWKGISDPPTLMNSVLLRVLERLPVESNLLEKLGQTVYGDLTDHSERANIWKHMSATVAAPFLEQTSEGWLRRLNSGVQLDPTIEQPLKNAISDPARLARHFQSNQSNLLAFALRMFHTFTELRESQLLDLYLNSPSLSRSSVTQVDAYQLGQLIKQRKWRMAATKVYQLVQWNRLNQFSDALRECYELLSWWDQGALYLSGLLPEYKLGDDDWWMRFIELTIELYAAGPNEQELWKRSGGDKSIIRMSGSGREIWQDVTRKLRYGGGGDKISTNRILEEMLKDFPNNQNLRLLKQLFEKNGQY